MCLRTMATTWIRRMFEEVLLVLVVVSPWLPRLASAAEVKPETGLTVTFTTGNSKVSDMTATPGVSLHVEAGKSPTPFLPGGMFTAVWEGAISAELRGNYS